MPQFKFNTISRADIERSKGGNIMIHAIDYDGNDHQLITGRPGSGKTTISLKRLERLVNIPNYKILFITYQILLAESLKNGVENNASSKIHRINMWLYQFGIFNDDDTPETFLSRIPANTTFDEVIIDEGQDLEKRFLSVLNSKSRKITVGADNAQKLHSKGTPIREILAELENTNPVATVKLNYNYRNSYELYNFARFFVPDDEQANNEFILDQMERKPETTPEVIQSLSEQESDNRLRVIIENNSTKNIAVVLFHTGDVNKFYKKIQSMGFDCIEYYYGKPIPSDFKNIIVTTYISVKGLEFEVVIMPEMHYAFTNNKHTGNHYYVGCTRAKEKLYLLYSGKNLPACLEEFEEDSYKLRPSENGTQRTTRQDIVEDDLPF
jgi:DNA helicase IV